VTHRDRQARLGGEPLQFTLPETTSGRIASATVGKQQQVAATGVDRFGDSPPTPQTVDGELRCVGGLPHAHMSAVPTDIVHPVRDRAALGIVREVVGVHLFRRVASGDSVAGEVADKFLVLGVEAQHRAAEFQSETPQSRHGAELSVSVGRRLAAESFEVGSQPVAGRSQQPPHHVGAGASTQLLGQFSQAVADPFRRVSGGRPRRFRFDSAQQVGCQRRIFFSRGGRPPPGKRTRSVGRPSKFSDNSARPRAMVSKFRPVTRDFRTSPPNPIRCDSCATNQRRAAHPVGPATDESADALRPRPNPQRVDKPHTHTLEPQPHPCVRPPFRSNNSYTQLAISEIDPAQPLTLPSRCAVQGCRLPSSHALL
jgi:hypothetical protein